LGVWKFWREQVLPGISVTPPPEKSQPTLAAVYVVADGHVRNRDGGRSSETSPTNGCDEWLNHGGALSKSVAHVSLPQNSGVLTRAENIDGDR
jgi:hypothetical protein